MAALLASSFSPVIYVAIGAGILGGAALFASIAAAGKFGLSPGRRALIHWTPIAITVLVARALGGWEIALGLIFGTSVAVMSTVLGSVSTMAPVGPAPNNYKRLWPFTLVAALIVFVSGFNGLLTWKHGMALLVEGLALYSLWRDSEDREWIDPVQHRPEDLVSPDTQWIALTIGVLLAMAGAYLATRGTADLQHTRVRLSPGTISATLLSLMLAAPMVQGDRRLAAVGASWVAATAEFGVVLLNLCLLLPIISFVPYVTAYFRAARAGHGALIDWSLYSPQVTVFPLAVWRIDTVSIVLLSLLMLPVSMGKWNLGREEGVVLIVVYCIYLAAVTIAGLGPV
jgi:Ca2+/Na+ antiporter